MKWLLRILAALVSLVVAVAIAAVLALPSLIESAEVRSRIEGAAYQTTGRALHYDTLEVGLLPPSLRVLGPRLSGERPDDPALLEAREVSLRVALLPLLDRKSVV